VYSKQYTDKVHRLFQYFSFITNFYKFLITARLYPNSGLFHDKVAINLKKNE